MTLDHSTTGGMVHIDFKKAAPFHRNRSCPRPSVMPPTRKNDIQASATRTGKNSRIIAFQSVYDVHSFDAAAGKAYVLIRLTNM
ncbi:MAG: hypothetical protein HC814_00615 [Rhodobacteraceae bacterium]|nr:hypothetical protein [Paracoccaceae bacterium]